MGIFAVGVAASLVTFVLQCSGCCLLERDSAGHVRRVRLGVGNNRARLARQSLQSECIDPRLRVATPFRSMGHCLGHAGLTHFRACSRLGRKLLGLRDGLCCWLHTLDAPARPGNSAGSTWGTVVTNHRLACLNCSQLHAQTPAVGLIGVSAQELSAAWLGSTCGPAGTLSASGFRRAPPVLDTQPGSRCGNLDGF